jgi:hypothetical protein
MHVPASLPSLVSWATAAVACAMYLVWRPFFQVTHEPQPPPQLWLSSQML